MRKRILGLLLAGVLSVSMLAGCGEITDTPSEDVTSEETNVDSSGDQSDVTLTFWTPTWRQAAEEVIIEDFMDKYPNIKIETTYMSSDDIKTNTKIAASSGTLPDMWYNWGGVLAEFYAETGMCLDLTNYAKENKWEEKYLSGALEQCKYGDQLIGLPQNLVCLAMYYRTDIFEQYGLTTPSTMEELEKVCDTLVANGITPFSTYGGSHMMRYTEALLEYYAGIEEHDSLLAIKSDWAESKAVENTFKKLKEWFDKGYFKDGALSDDSTTASMYVFSGECAMIMENPGMASTIVANGYDTALYDWFAFPCESNEDGSGRLSAYAKICQFNADITEEKLEAAMLFWDYYYSDESLESHEAIEQPTARIGAKLPENYALADGMLEIISENGGYSTMDLKVPSEIMSQFFAVSDAVILGTAEPENTGAEIQAAIESYLANQ